MNWPELWAALLGAPPPAATAVAALAAVGVTRLDVWRRLLLGWLEWLDPDEVAHGLWPAALQAATQAPDPDLAALNLCRLQEAVSGATLPRQLLADPRFAHDLLFLLGFGSFTGDALVRDPGLCDLLLDPDRLRAPRAADELTAELVGQVLRMRQRDHRGDALRRWKRQEFVRIIARDLLLHEPQQAITQEVSAVADACVQAALAGAARDHGLPVGEQGEVRGLAVVAMGKWGSEELNYNSDIDLLCVWLPAVDGPDLATWEAVVRDLANDLDQPTREGRVFRVDFRLRPEGGSGTLVRSLESCAAYYQEHGAAWEAQALTRARCAAGDLEVGRRFEQLAQRVAFGTRMGRLGVAHIRQNRQTLDQRADAERDVKEGRGGIRDIEFTVQLLQLHRGVTDPTVRRRNTWEALAALTAAGAISELERRRLAEAYDFLRRVEHLLQLQPVAPTRVLPTDRGALRRLARGLGYRDSGPLTATGRFLEDYRSHTAAARELCRHLFFNPIPLGSPDADAAMAELLDPLEDDAEVVGHLAAVPFDDPFEARRRLLFLAHGEPPMRLPAEIQAAFVELLPALLSCVQRMPDPDAALLWFERFISRAGGRELFYRFLAEHPPVIELLCRIGGYSEALSQTICDYPEYLDRVIDPRFVSVRPTRSELLSWVAERAAPLRQVADRLDDLRRWRRREHFRIGVQDLLGTFDSQATTGELATLAEVCLEALLSAARQSIDGGAELPFAIVGLGKLGGQEIHYASDLDVLFVYHSDDPAAPRIAEQMAQFVLRAARERTRAGWLYDLDARLRPFGGNSQLTRSVAGYSAYYERSGEAWERLALTRLRPVAGDPAVGAALRQVTAAFAFDQPVDAATLGELRRVKHRIETERLDVTDTAHLDLKLEPGGILDIEFLAQILQIQAGPGGPREANTAAALRALAAAGCLPPAEADLLHRHYLHFRRVETRLQITLDRPHGLLPLDDEALSAAAKRLGWSLAEAHKRPEQLVADLRERLRSVRRIYEARVGVVE
ncbi:MAG: hypothetical protein IT204_00595 [Fimbriimonadaceae bacterium]|nr:hypothetical protein [Fimbriimonadaceae bacterium]